MATLTLGDDLEVGGFAGPCEGEVYLRGFEIVDGDTVMSRTHIACDRGSGFELLRSFDLEIVDIAWDEGDRALLCLSGRGEMFRLHEGRWSTVCGPIAPATRVSQLLRVRGQFHAIGPRTGLYRLDGRNWVQLPLPPGEAHVLDAAPDGPTALLVVGTDGYCARLDGAVSETIDLGTDVHLCALASYRDKIYVAGHRATLLRRDGEAWEVLFVGDDDTDFLQFAQFGGRLLLAAEVEILVVLDDRVETFAEQDIQRMFPIGDVLFGLGMESATRFDGTGWSPVTVALHVPDQPDATARPRE